MKTQSMLRMFHALVSGALLLLLLAAAPGQTFARGAPNGVGDAKWAEPAAPSAVFTVNSNDDTNDGNCNGAHCSLREAINAANANAGADTIEFNIGGGGVQTISPTSALPLITDPVTIDGGTQPGYSGTPLIELNGTNAGGGAIGLVISAGGSTVKGLVINRFGSSGIALITNGGNTIIGNFIGTNVAGDADQGNGMSGIEIGANSGANIIGGSKAAGPCASPCNLISGNDDVGILIFSGDGNLIQGNHIGTDVDGVSPLGNNFDGIGIVDPGSSYNWIGGDMAGEGNIVAFNGWHGVSIRGGTASTGNHILRNSIFANVHMGIDLGDDDIPTVNDPGDGDTGSNNLQNFPVIRWAYSASRRVRVSLNSTPNTRFLIQVFETRPCDRNKHGEGKKFIGSKLVTTNATGDVAVIIKTKRFVANRQITATATDPNGNTSEFSKCKRAIVSLTGSSR